MREIKFLFDVDFKQLNCNNILFINDMKMYTDGANKCILFKIKNKFSQPIDEITLKIVQYNKDEIVLRREIVKIDNKIFKKKRNTLIKDLINVEISTVRIEIEVEEIKFINLIYDHGTIYSTSKESKKAPKVKDEVAVKKYGTEYSSGFKATAYIMTAVAILIIITLIIAFLFDHSIFESILDFTN